MHDVADADQRAAERTAGVEIAILIGGEALALHQRHRDRVAQHQHHGGGGGGRQPHGARLGRLGQQKRHVGRLQQRGLQIAGDTDERNAQPLGMGDEIAKLGGLAAIGQHQQRIVDGDHAEIAMAGFRRMDEKRRRAGGGERGGDLARDMAALAHAADHDPALDPQKRIDGAGEIAVQ